MLTIAACVMSVSFAASLATAGPIEDREATMKAVGKAMTALASIAKKERPFEAAFVKENADIIHTKLVAVKDMFPPGSEKGGETEAKPEIWTDRAGFEAALENGQQASSAMATVVAEDQFMPALGKLGSACKGCHDKFRQPKD